jgi:hypothetical protein
MEVFLLCLFTGNEVRIGRSNKNRGMPGKRFNIVIKGKYEFVAILDKYLFKMTNKLTYFNYFKTIIFLE